MDLIAVNERPTNCEFTGWFWTVCAYEGFGGLESLRSKELIIHNMDITVITELRIAADNVRPMICLNCRRVLHEFVL